MSYSKRNIFTTLLLTLCTACASQPAVLTLAEKTAANVGVISSQMGQLSNSSKAMAERRSANVAQLHAANTEMRARYKYDLELTNLAGHKDDLKLIENIEAWGEKVAQFQVDRAKVAEAFQKELLATQSKIDTQSAALSEIAVALSGLAQKENSQERLTFMVGYTAEVVEQMDKRLQQDDDTAKRVNALLDKLKN